MSNVQGNVGAYISSLMDVIGEQEEDASFIHNPVNAYNLLRFLFLKSTEERAIISRFFFLKTISSLRVSGTWLLGGEWWRTLSRPRWREGRRTWASE